MKTLLHTALIAVLSTAILVGCGGSGSKGNAAEAPTGVDQQKSAEKAVMDFIQAATKADFDAADKFVFTDDNGVQLLWMTMKQVIRQGQEVEASGKTPDVAFLTCDFEVFHHPMLDTVIKMAQNNAMSEFTQYGVSDLRMVILKQSPLPKLLKTSPRSRAGLRGMVAVCKDGVWKVIPGFEDIDVELEDLEKLQ